MSIGSVVNSVLGTGGDGGASATQRQALDAISKIQFPSIEEMKIYLQKLVQQGQLTPEMAQTFYQQKTAYNDASIDPTGRNAQVEALDRLKTIGDKGGMDDIDKARVNDINSGIATANRGAQDAIVQNAAERGVGGSGLEYAARLNAQQGAATTGSKNAADIAADAQARALQSITAAGNMGSTIYGEDATLASKKAEAQDAINRFNTGNAQNVNLTNTAATNNANAANLAEKQRISDANVGNTNAAEVHNKGLAETDFQNQMAKAGAMAGEDNQIAGTQLDQAKRQDAVTGEVLGAGGQIISGYKKKPADATSTPAPAPVFYKGGKVCYEGGGRVPGRAPMPGDAPGNDVVNARLSPGEIVVPRSKAKSPAKAAAFAHHAAGGAHPEDIESVLSALSSIRSKLKKPKAA